MSCMILENRRFTCVSPTLVRIEFAPDGVFEDRRSMVAYAERQAQPFAEVRRDGLWDVLDTGAMQIRTRSNETMLDRNTLEIRWSDTKLMQAWRPGDIDYQNLGGALRSLDRYGGVECRLDGVHPAGMESPDGVGTIWPAWLQCEENPLYTDLHPAPPEALHHGGWLPKGGWDANNGTEMERVWNGYKACRRFCPGVLSRSGYYLLNDSDGAVLDADGFPEERTLAGAQDWYFFAYGRDYKQALRDFRLLSGPAPIPRHKSLGIIFSRWPAFSETEIREMAETFRSEGYPLSTLVMDMEWHTEGWGTWDYNPELIPDPQRFFALCRQYDLEVTFNDHPLDVHEKDSHYEAYVAAAGPDVEIRERTYNKMHVKMAKVDMANKQQVQAFCKVCHTHILEDGMDYWWNDGSRGQMRSTAGQLVANKTFFEESEREGRRGMLLARYGGLGSHRYGGFFTGDDNADWHVLRLQVEFNIRLAGVGVGHISHDIGGFMLPARHLVENEKGVKIVPSAVYVRWLQFGVFNSILRFHCAPGSGSRLPYDYDSLAGGACRKWLRVRHSLLPYIYTVARDYYDTGLSPTRGLFIEEPENPAAYRFDAYYFGPSLLVAPVFDDSPTRSLYLPAGFWWAFDGTTCVEGGQEITIEVGLADYPVYVRAGAILPRRDPDGRLHAGHIEKLHLDVYPGADGESWLYEDDGCTTAYHDGEFCRTRLTQHVGQDGKLVLAGEVAEGTPLGEHRTISLRVRLDAPPASVKLNGEQALACEPDGALYRIILPQQETAQTWRLEIAVNL